MRVGLRCAGELMRLRFNRREAVLASAAAAALLPAGRLTAATPWRAGALRHVLPSANAEALLLKCSFTRPLTGRLQADLSGHRVDGVRTDSEGRFWTFWATGLEPGTEYRITLRENDEPLSDPWPLRTFPAADAAPERFRLLTFMCPGGDESARGPRGIESFRPIATRQALLQRGLAFAPDAVVANGDHIYWDQKSWLQHHNDEIRALTRAVYDEWGYFDPAQAMIGTANEALLKRVGDEQIARLYGTILRSTPSFFLPDDHDYLENDEAEERFVTFPPDEQQREFQRVTQRLYYPEFLPDPLLPQGLPGMAREGWAQGLSRSFGVLRFGKLVEALLYDSAGFLSLKDGNAGLLPPEVEAWVTRRIGASDAAQLLHIPSFPIGWTAGKWREWYPDVVAAPTNAAGETVVATHGFAGGVGRLTTDRPKYLWQKGWWSQHQRLMTAMARSPQRPVVLGGDIHAVGATKLIQSGDLSLAENPVHAFLVGSIGASKAGFPSFARGTPPSTPAMLRAEDFRFPEERNGFTLVDVEPARTIVRQFSWDETMGVNAISTLEPFNTLIIEGKG